MQTWNGQSARTIYLCLVSSPVSPTQVFTQARLLFDDSNITKYKFPTLWCYLVKGLQKTELRCDHNLSISSFTTPVILTAQSPDSNIITESLLKMHIPKTHPRHTESGTLGVGPGNLCLTSAPTCSSCRIPVLEWVLHSKLQIVLLQEKKR